MNSSRIHDLAGFVSLLNRVPQSQLHAVRTLFNPAGELMVTRAPGRLDVMGGIADYSGSLVMQWPIREATFAAIQPSSDDQITIVSLGADDRSPAVTFPLDVIQKGNRPTDYASVRSYFSEDPARQWAAYAAGTLSVLMQERGLRLHSGVRILLSSAVPEGKGVSSSAAIEVATMQAIEAAYHLKMDARETAILCQKVENLIVGAPCGVMDQMASALGLEGRFLTLHCQPAEVQEFVPLPTGLAVWGIDSGVRHSVSGADYGTVRAAAFMGLRILSVRLGVDRTGIWNGYLANIAPSELVQDYARYLPEIITGAAFLDEFGGIEDPISSVEPGRDYAVRAAASHPIHENFRVNAFRQLLQDEPGDQTARLLGELMYQSHAGYSSCGIGSDGTDLLVSMVRAMDPACGLYGAKITGGGSGGTVAVLGRTGSDEAIKRIAAEYCAKTGRASYIFTGSSPGAAEFGAVRLRNTDGIWGTE